MALSANTSSTERLLKVIRGKGAAAESRQAQKASQRPPRKGAAPVIGVDIAPDNLRLAKIALADGAPRLLGYWSVPYVEGRGPKDPGFPTFLADKIDEFRGRDKKAVIWSLVSSAQAETWHIRIPKVPRSKLSETVYWTAQKEKSFDDAEYLMDYEVQGEIMDKGVPKIQVLVYMVPRETVAKAKAMFAAAGIKPAGVTISPIALQSLFRSGLVTENGESCANIYIGRNWSRIDVFAKGDLVLSRGVNTGTSSLVAAMAEAYADCAAKMAALKPAPRAPAALELDEFVLELGPEDGEIDPAAANGEGEPVFELEADAPEAAPLFELETDAAPAPEPAFELETDGAEAAAPQPKPAEAPSSPTMTEEQAKTVLLAKLLDRPLDASLPGAELTAEEVVTLSGAAVERLVRQIERTFDHFINSQGGDSIQRIFFSGDICTNRHFLDVLTTELGVPCSLLDPLGVLAGAPAAPSVPDSSAERLAFNLVCGLALCDARDTPNLLATYTDKDKVRQIRNQGNIIYAVFLVLAAAMAVFWFYQRSVSKSLQAELDGLSARIATYNPKVDEARLLGMAGKAAKLQADIKRLSEKYEGLAAINEISRLTPDNIRLRSMTLEMSAPESAAPDKSKAKKDPAPKILILEGRIGGATEMFDAMLATYLAKLQYSPLFASPVVHKREIVSGKGDKSLHFILHVNMV